MERTRFYLKPGEKVRSPRILLLDWQGESPIAGNNILRRLLLKHYCPRESGELALPPVAHMTFSTYIYTGQLSEAGEFEALRRAAPAGDVLRDMAVKCEGQIRNPTGCQALKLRLSGVEFRREELASDRQIVERQDGAETDLRVLAARRPECPAGAPPAGPEFAAALAASAFVQSDHPDVVARARRIVGGRTNLYERTLAIHDWVHANVRKEPTVSLPSALDVLRRLAGDCNEHTYLFVALARAAGIPAKIEVGIVYHAGAFYYHAWPAAYVGEWLEMDPTFGQAAVDATHLALAEGELASQLEIMKVVGRLKVKVLEESGGEGQKREP